MITGVHATIFTTDPEGMRAFFRDTLGLSSVDAGGGWLIFACRPPSLPRTRPRGRPPSAVPHVRRHRGDARGAEGEGVELTDDVSDEGFGLMTYLRLPDGSELGLYEPRHPSPRSPSG